MGEVRMGGYEVMLVVRGDASGATAEIVKTKNALDALTNSAQKSVAATQKAMVSSTAQTYELSKATRQLSLGLSSLSFVPVIGNFAAMGTNIAFAAGGIKNLAAGIKTLGGVSLPIIGSLTGGVVALAGLITGFGAGVLLDKIFKINKVTAIGAIKEMIEVRNLMKSIKEEAEAMAPALEKSTTELAKIGVMPGATWAQTMERMKEMEKAGEIIYNKELGRYMSAAEAAIRAQEKIKQANINAMEAQKETLTGQLSNLKVYYSGLEKLHNDYIEKAKTKSKELLDTENSIRSSMLETSNIMSSIRQKGMSSTDAYNEKVKQLGEQELQIWMRMEAGDEKIEALKNLQQQWAGFTDEVREGDKVVVSAADAQAKATQKVKDIGDQLTWAQEDKIKKIQEEKAAYESTAASVATAMQAAQASILDITNQIAQVDMALAKEKKLDINVNQAFDNIKKVREMIDAIPDVTTKKIIIETYTKSSPAMPFSEGIAYMKEQLGSLPTGADFTVDMSSLTGMMEQYRITSAAYSTLLGSVQSLPGIPHHGAATQLAGLQSSMKMVENLFNVGIVQSLSGVLSQLYGHEKIDSMLQDLIEGYLGNIRSFQTGIDYVPMTQLAVVHQGERITPAGDNRNYSGDITLNSVLNVNGANVKDGRRLARQYDEEMADMIRTGRSKITKAIREKLRYYNNFQ